MDPEASKVAGTGLPSSTSLDDTEVLETPRQELHAAKPNSGTLLTTGFMPRPTPRLPRTVAPTQNPHGRQLTSTSPDGP